MSVLMTAGGVKAQELGQWSFTNGATDWTAVNNATVSDVARRPGGKSLLLRQTKDEEADSAWLSPVMKNPGKPVRLSVWAADNYSIQKDASYAAAFEVVACDTNGTVAGGSSWAFTVVPWEDKRQIPQFPHTMTREGLQWKYYVSVKPAPGEFFRVRLLWPKPLMRGECYFTDVRVSIADDAAVKTGAEAPAASRYAFEISTPANANLFFFDDPLRFEFLLYATDGQPVGELKKPEIRYEITDYERFRIASGTIPFAGAVPLVNKALSQWKQRDRKQNLRLSTLIPDAAAKEVGREFFIHAKLMDGDRVLAEDTVPYAVVNPRRIDPKDYGKCRFVEFYEGGGFTDAESMHEGQTLMDKMGAAIIHDFSTDGWKKAQATMKDPLQVPKLTSLYPKLWCPNLEQMRGNKAMMDRLVPEGAKVDDPRTPGCPTFDIDAYVAYLVEYVRVNRAAISQVIPSGLERFIDTRTLELQRKSYAALKKAFPDLPVGMMTWGVNSSDEVVDQILREKLYEVADFFNTHVYLSSVDWTASERLRKELKKLGIERPLVSSEFARVGGCDQLQGSRDLIASLLDAHAHGLYRVTYFNMYVNDMPSPPLRDPVLRGEFPGDGFQWMQYVDRPRVSDAIKDTNWGRGLFGTDQRGASLMPMLKTTAYYNLVQAVECADFKAVFQPTPRSIAYVYARDGKTLCYLFLREPNAPTTLALTSDVPYVMQDLYGRTDRVTPAGGTSLVVATLDPLLLTFGGEVPALHDAKTGPSVLKPAEGGLALPVIARGTTGKAQLTIPPVFSKAFKARVVATVDGTWPKVKEEKVEVAAGKSSQVELPIAIAAGQAAGSYTFTTRLYDGDKLVSVLKQPLQVNEVLTAQMTGVPMTKAQDPAIAVSLRSLADKPMSGTVRITNRYFSAGFEPAVMEQAYTVGPQGTVEIRFPVPRDQANLASSYELRATITDKSGFTITSEDDVSFQACVKTKMPIKVDGDLSDWKLDELIPIPYEKWHRGPRDPKEFSGRFYSRWDDEKLYFAAEITDSVPVVNGTNQLFWNDDNIMFCLYPWGWHMGEPLNTGYYREHLGPIQGGKASFLRAGYVPSGPSTSEGAEIAVTRTATGWVYEWAYPKASLYPLVLGKGGAFRLSMSVWDQFKVEKKTQEDWGQFSWLTFAGFNSSVNAQPNLWRQFQMVE